IFINPSRFLLLVLLCWFSVWRRRPRLGVSVLPFFLPAGTSPYGRHIFSRTKQPQEPEHLGEKEHPQSLENIISVMSEPKPSEPNPAKCFLDSWSDKRKR
uniref:Uncharacterized protein n=1 Tax=Takifugu rubripes TaxID=31033 RepID=A0A674N727_TAKRU